MNGHPRGQAKVSVHCRWPLIRGTDGHVEMNWDIDNVAVHSRWPLATGVAQGRRYCIGIGDTTVRASLVDVAGAILHLKPNSRAINFRMLAIMCIISR